MNGSMWLVRAGEKGYMLEEFIEKNVIAIGWVRIGDLSSINSRDEIKGLVRHNYPDYSDGAINITSGQIFRFRSVFKKGDQVITYNPEIRDYNIGIITSDYEYNETLLDEMKHIRRVEWKEKLLRDRLSLGARNTLGSIMTIIEVPPDVRKEINGLLEGSVEELVDGTGEINEEYDPDTIKEDVIVKAHEFIKDKIQTLDWEEMEELVAGIFRGMGYKTQITQRGADRGRDILASPDGLGLEEPRIIIEVKHRVTQMGSSDIRSFTGGLRGGDKGVYVSTGGFTREAKYEAERSNVPVAIIDLDRLAELLTQYYDDFDVQTKSLVPLKKIYWPL